jgi:hypothetical protein
MSDAPNTPEVEDDGAAPAEEPKPKGGRPKGAADTKPRKRRGKSAAYNAVIQAAPAVDLSTPVLAARAKPPQRTTIDDKLLDDACNELAGGAWPKDLPTVLGVASRRWRGWLETGERDHAEGEDTPEADLWGVVSRSKSRLEQAYRSALLTMALTSKNWQAASWLLARLTPRVYSEQVTKEVEGEVLRLLQVVRDSVDPETYDKIVAALESARAST